MFTKKQTFFTFMLVAIFATFAFAQNDVVNNDDVVVVDVVDDTVNNNITEEPQPQTQTRRAIDLDRLLGDDEYTDIFEDKHEVAAVDSVADTTIDYSVEITDEAILERIRKFRFLIEGKEWAERTLPQPPGMRRFVIGGESRAEQIKNDSYPVYLIIGDIDDGNFVNIKSDECDEVCNEVLDSLYANELVRRGLEETRQTTSAARQTPVNRAALDGDPIIEDGRTINFAQNLSGYRSPRMAMLLSLLVPGLGQWYARNNTKAAAFAGAEVVAIGAAIWLNATANSKRDDAYRFANNNFDVDKLEDYATRLNEEFQNRWDALPDPEIPEGEDPSLYSRDTTLEIFWESAVAPYDSFFFAAAQNRSTFFYTSIGDRNYTPGWSDNEPDLDIILGMYRDESDNGHVGQFGTYQLLQSELDRQYLFYLVRRIVDGVERNTDLRGYSNYQQRYNDMLDDANSYRDAVNYMFYVMIVNRIASAIDAGFTARSYNARLLNEETVFNRLSVEQQFVFTGSEVSPGIALRIRF